jgi:methionine aminopeptidase
MRRAIRTAIREAMRRAIRTAIREAMRRAIRTAIREAMRRANMTQTYDATIWKVMRQLCRNHMMPRSGQSSRGNLDAI